MEIYEKLFVDAVSNCDPGDLVEFEFINDEAELETEIIRISEIDVDDSVTLKGISEINENEIVTHILDPDLHVTVLGG